MKMLITEKMLLNAWEIVKTKGSSGGVDGVSIEQYESKINANIAKLINSLSNRTWKPQPYLRVKIPKKSNEFRKLGLLVIEDKIIQQAIKSIIEPIFEKVFSSNSYGYRKGKGAIKAVKRLLFEVNKQKNNYVVKFDIDNYFDNINREKLMSLVRNKILDAELCRVIDLCIQMGVVTKSLSWRDINVGVPQGSVLSPLLSNLYLNELDKFITTTTMSYVRYADDFVIICSDLESAQHIDGIVRDFLEQKLNLKLNPTIISSVDNGIEFLGVIVKRREVSISDDKQLKLATKIKTIDIQDETLTPKSRETIFGIQRYYANLISQDQLKLLDNYIFHRMRELSLRKNIKRYNSIIKLIDSIPLFAKYSLSEKTSKVKQLYEDIKTDFEVQKTKMQQQNRQLINSRKLEYRKLESQNFDLVVASYGHSIGIQNDNVVVKRKGVVTQRTNSNLRHITILTDGVSISSNAIRHCADNTIPIDIFDNRHKHSCTIISPQFMTQNHWGKQHELSIVRRFYFARQIIIGKIKNQLNMVKYFHKYHKNNYELTEVYNQFILLGNDVLYSIKELKLNSNTKYQDDLMGYESRVAVGYWGYIRALLVDDNVAFEGREHKGASDLMNSMLNYGYALIYPRVWQSLLVAKLNPYIGFIHYQQGKPSLLFDLIELFRSQTVDRVIISLIQKKEPLSIVKGRLSEDSRRLITQNIFERLSRFEKYRGEEMRFEDIIKRQADELARGISEDVSYKPYISKW